MTAVDDALQAALAAEHEAVFGYGLLGPRLATQAQRDLAVRYQSAHEQVRDATAAALVAAGVVPIANAPDYPALYPVSDPAAALALAVRLETSAAAAWRYVYAAAAAGVGPRTAPSVRTVAQDALTASAVRLTRWRIVQGSRTPTVPFPGI